MPRKNRNNDHNHRGRGGRGRGRGAHRGSSAQGRGHEVYPLAGYELDYVAQRYPLEAFGTPDTRRGYESTPQSRSGGKTPQWATDNLPRGNGYGTPRGRSQNFGFGNGRGRGEAQYRARGWPLGMSQRGRGIGTRRPPNLNASLSDLLYLERPLLRPVNFVRATQTPFLFRESEDIFQPPSTSNNPAVQSNVPTAERVAYIFNNTQPFLPAETISEGEASDELEEIDFADLGTLRAQVDAAEHTAQRKIKPDLRNAVVKETFTSVHSKEQPRHVRGRGRGRADEMEHRTKTRETTVTADDTTLQTSEQSIEALRTKKNHDLGAFPGERSTWNPSGSAGIKSTLPRPNNTRADLLTTFNTTGRSHDVFEQMPGTAGTGHISRDRGFHTSSKERREIDFADLGTYRERIDAVERTAQRKTKPDPRIAVMEETFTVACNEERPRDVPERSGTKETEQSTTTRNEESAAVATSNPTLQALEQSIETLQVKENHNVGAFLSERSPGNPSESVEVELALSKPKNSRADLELEDNPSAGNTAGKSPDILERTAATAGTEYNGGGHGFFIDTQPTEPFTSSSASDAIPTCGSRRGELLGEEEEIIVYVAPYPRPGRIQPAHDTTSRVELSTCSLLTGTSETRGTSKEQKEASIAGGNPVLSNPQPLSLDSMSLDFQRTEPSTQPRYPPAFTPSQKKKGKLRLKKKESRMARRRNARTQFRTFGAMLSESRLRDANEKERKDEKWETRRMDDSDIDWGDDDDSLEKSDAKTGTEALVVGDADDPSNSEGGMDLDPDVDPDVNTMLRFVESMSAKGSRFVAMDDTEDKRQMIEEDQDGVSSFSVEDSSDEDDTGSCDGSEEDEEEAAVLQLEEQFMFAESDGEDLELDSDDEDALLGKEPRVRKGSKNNRGTTRSGASVDLSPFKRHMKAKDKVDYLPEDLQAQWERDRAKKAENKRLRKEVRMLASLDPSVPKKGGKKARKLMVAALKEMEHLCNALDDMSSIEANMRSFVANINGRRSMPLLPMTKGTRKIVHELAAAFNLKSVSKGRGPGRYVTLVKTTRTGIINEGKVKAIMRRATRGSGRVEEGSQKKGRYVPSHREGDEVGKEAPAIGESNVGFKMLASMGWSEGAKIGGDTSVGIEVPLTAVIKKSRLGLGATRT